MRLYLKKLNGPECSVEVSPTVGVIQLRDMASRLLAVPRDHTKLVFKGKTLLDDKNISAYNIGAEGKVIVVEKKPDAIAASQLRNPVRSLWEEAHILLRRHFTEEDSEAVLCAFKKNFERDMASLSLDDIERLATSNLEALKRKT